MRKIGFLGCGKIGQALYHHIKEKGYADVVFIEDPKAEIPGETVVTKPDPKLYEQADLILECATASVLKEHLEQILSQADLLMFSVTAFSDPEFEQEAERLCEKYRRHIYLPHGAILGLDGIFDGRFVWKKVTIVTTKSPKSLGRTDEERTVVYDGPTRGACKAYPRNVNVHASIALAGIGFDQTCSKIISDPAVSTNAHEIHLEGDGMDIRMNIETFAAGAVTGAYTPHSACGSLDRICEEGSGRVFV